MNRINQHITIEFILSLLLIITYFLPWVDMAMFVKVVGWDLPNVQRALAEMSKEFVEREENNDFVYGIYSIPLLSLIGIVMGIVSKQKIARITLTISAFIGIILSIYLFSSLPNIGSGVYMLFVISILALTFSFFSVRERKINLQPESSYQ